MKIVEKEASFDELLAKAQAKEKEADFFAAANAYQDARSHENCPVDKRGELEAQLGKMNSARKFLFMRRNSRDREQEWNAKKGLRPIAYSSTIAERSVAIRKCWNMPPVQLNLNVVQKNWMKN